MSSYGACYCEEKFAAEVTDDAALCKFALKVYYEYAYDEGVPCYV